jgi:peptidoglycan/xylan/chitin deacetylase (PgdA/CDA1 family)
MSWDRLRSMASDPLVTIGAHTNTHFALAKLTEAEALFEIEAGAKRLERELGVKPMHLSYPYGGEDAAGPREFRLARELGFRTAVTTRKGLLYAGHSHHLTALPRVSLNGDYQDERYLSVLLSGAPFAFWNGFRRISVA